MENSYAVQLAACLFFLVAGSRLIRLSRRTREQPELLLGLYFVLAGLAYLGWVLPLMGIGLEPVAVKIADGAWILYCLGVVPQLLFIRSVFRQEAGWALWIVVGCGGALAISSVVLTLYGSRSPQSADPFQWARWLGYTIPCGWIFVEALLCHRTAVRRARIGLSDPVVANRYLLLALFGLFQTFACFSDLVIEFGLTPAPLLSSTAGDAVLGGLESAGIAMLWLAFFPPAVYLAWLSGSKSMPSGLDEVA